MIFCERQMYPVRLPGTRFAEVPAGAALMRTLLKHLFPPVRHSARAGPMISSAHTAKTGLLLLLQAAEMDKHDRHPAARG